MTGWDLNNLHLNLSVNVTDVECDTHLFFLTCFTLALP